MKIGQILAALFWLSSLSCHNVADRKSGHYEWIHSNHHHLMDTAVHWTVLLSIFSQVEYKMARFKLLLWWERDLAFEVFLLQLCGQIFVIESNHTMCDPCLVQLLNTRSGVRLPAQNTLTSKERPILEYFLYSCLCWLRHLKQRGICVDPVFLSHSIDLYWLLLICRFRFHVPSKIVCFGFSEIQTRFEFQHTHHSNKQERSITRLGHSKQNFKNFWFLPAKADSRHVQWRVVGRTRSGLCGNERYRGGRVDRERGASAHVGPQREEEGGE